MSGQSAISDATPIISLFTGLVPSAACASAIQCTQRILFQVITECERMIAEHNATTQDPNVKLQTTDIKRTLEGITSFWITKSIPNRRSSVHISSGLWSESRISIGDWAEGLFGAGEPAFVFNVDDAGSITSGTDHTRATVGDIAVCAYRKASVPTPALHGRDIRAYEVMADCLAECEKIVAQFNTGVLHHDFQLKIANHVRSDDGLESFWIMEDNGSRPVLVSRAWEGISISMPREPGAAEIKLATNSDGNVVRLRTEILQPFPFKNLVETEPFTIPEISSLAINRVHGVKDKS